jgi:UDP-N-acetylglucosamine:LPS N-acetylglucosamine transferase
VKKIKVLAIASMGGHWVELLRLTRVLDSDMEIIYVSTYEKCKYMVANNLFYKIPDFSRWDFYKMAPAFFKALKIIWKESPDAVISTGAAPGLICLLAAKLFGKKTIWLDSFANAYQLSMCGKIATRFASRTFTQWEEMAGGKIYYTGNILN